MGEQNELFGGLSPASHAFTKSCGYKFIQWLDKLNEIAAARGVEGKPLSEQTGDECWRVYYDDDYTPGEALAEDWSYDD